MYATCLQSTGMLQDAKQNIVISEEKQKEQYDRKHSYPLIKFNIGKQVLKKDFNEKVVAWITNI